ncbi:MAG: hypothetical protein Fur0010_07940 [Bdellovibrio sp.]
MKWLKDFFLILKSFVPDYGALMKMGYKAKTFNQDFILEKQFDHFKISLHQGIEPFNPKFGEMIDFDLDGGACIVICFGQKPKNDLDFSDLFENVLEKEHFIFLFDDHMDFHGKNTAEKILQVEEILKSSVF